MPPSILAHARHAGLTAARWLAEPAPLQGVVIDLAYGRSPMRTALASSVVYVGLDCSPVPPRSPGQIPPQQLRPQQQGPARVEVTRLPIADGRATAAVRFLSLHRVPIGGALGEIRRVLIPGGLLLAALLPDEAGPPVLREPAALSALLAACGFVLLDDDRRSFAHRRPGGRDVRVPVRRLLIQAD